MTDVVPSVPGLVPPRPGTALRATFHLRWATGQEETFPLLLPWAELRLLEPVAPHPRERLTPSDAADLRSLDRR